jgi:AcrR family transcriptional regulator
MSATRTSTNEAPAESSAVTGSRRDRAVARALDAARVRAEGRVQTFLDAAIELMNSDSGEFTVQEVVTRSGQSLRTFYNYFAGKDDLLLALFEDSIRSAAAHLQQTIAEADEPIVRLRSFVFEYYGMCRPESKEQRATRPAPAMVEVAQQLLTSDPRGAARAFAPLVVMLERLLADNATAGGIRPGLDHRRIAGVVLQAIMFNAFSTTISGASSVGDDREAAEMLWDLLRRGITTA